MAAVSFWLTYDHVECALRVHVEKVALRKHVIAARPDLMTMWGHVNVSILPYKQRGRTRSVRQRDLYFEFDEEVAIPNVKTTYVGGTGLRIRFYLSNGRRLKGKRLADECKLLHEIALTSERTYNVMTLTPEVSDLYARTRDHVAHKQVLGLSVGEKIRKAGRILRLSGRSEAIRTAPSIAVQLNYDFVGQAILVHLKRAKMLKRIAKVVIFEVQLIMIDGKVERIVRSKLFVAEEAINIIHEGFRLRVAPEDLKFSTVYVLVLALKGNNHDPFRRQYLELKGSIAFGANSSGVKERRHFRDAIIDETPTDLVWFPFHEPTTEIHIDRDAREYRHKKKNANAVSPNRAYSTNSLDRNNPQASNSYNRCNSFPI